MSLFDSIGCVSIAVPSIEEALPAYVDGLGLEPTSDVITSERGYNLRWIELGRDGKPFLELLEPTSDQGPISRFLEKRGPGVYQVRLFVDDLDAAVAELESRGMRMTRGADVPGQARVAFVHPRSTHGVLFEIMERES